MAPSCPAQCSHYARHSLACSPCQQLPWQPQPKACKRSLTENEGKENIGRKKRMENVFKWLPNEHQSSGDPLKHNR